jgi:hypothetical protein
LAGAFGVALLLALLILWLFRPARRNELSQPTRETGQFEAWVVSSAFPTSLTEGPAARSAYGPAADTARAWQPDAQPAIASAHWRPRQGRWPTAVVWMFQFYSPETQRLAVVAVDGGRAQLIQETLSPYPLMTFDVAAWEVDSHSVLRTWWDEGGAFFVSSHGIVELTAQLRISQEDDRLVWRVIGVAGDQTRQVVVDGTTGDRLLPEN